jgi:hypothetical protein
VNWWWVWWGSGNVKAVDAIVTSTYDGFTVKAKGLKMAYVLQQGKQVKVRVDYVDAQGQPAVVDGAVAWASSAPQTITIQPDTSDSQICLLRSGQALGTSQVNATADADLGEGTRELICTMEVQVVGGEAVGGVISPIGEPTDMPQPEAARAKK